MSAGVGYGRRRSRMPSGMEEMRWYRTRQGCRDRPSGRGVESWNLAVLSAVGYAARAPGGPASSSRSRASSKHWRSWSTR